MHFAYDDSSSGMRKYIRFTYIRKIEDHGGYEFDVDSNDGEASDPSCWQQNDKQLIDHCIGTAEVTGSKSVF